MQELLPGQAPEPAREQEADALPRLRLTGLSLPVSLAAAGLSGVLLWLAFPPADLGPLAFVGLAPLLWVVRGVRARRGFLLGWFFGLVYFGLLMSWLRAPTVLGWALYTVWQSLWAGAGFALVAAAWRQEHPMRSAFGTAAIWATVEWAKQAWPFGGITWAGIGYTQHDNPLTLPAASWVGVFGLAFLVVAVNGLLVVGLSRRRGRGVALAAAAALVALPVLIPLEIPDGREVDVAIVQGNIPPTAVEAGRPIRNRLIAEEHADLSLQLAGRSPDLMVWPENAVDDDPTRIPALGRVVRDAVRRVGAPSLVGAITNDDEGHIFNENLMYSPAGEIVDRYAKNHILPFGEYVPFRRFLTWIPDVNRVRDDLTPGEGPGRFAIPGVAFSAAICFENNFPDLVRAFTAAESGFIVISTNNSTFERTSAARQHLALSEVRAVENGRWVVHAALTGISGIVNHRGEVISKTPLFEQAILRGGIPLASGRTIYNRFGGWVQIALAVGALLALLAVRTPKRRAAEPLGPNPRASVVLPTYNERETIEEAIRRLRTSVPGIGILVVDDGSPDGTADVVRELEDITLIERAGKQGLASAYREGFRRAIDDGAELIVEMDADLSHRPEDLPRLLAAARENDLVIGSRYVAGGAIQNWGLLRKLLSRGGNIYARLLLGAPITDATSGYRVFRRELLEDLLGQGITSEGYGFQVELAYRSWQLGYAVGEAPITFEERRAGESKLSRGIVVEALLRVAGWALRDRVFRRGGPRTEAARTS